MANLDWSQCPAVESIPDKVSGAWVFRGTRMPVQTVFENLEAGMSVEEITEVFDVTAEEVKAVLHFASGDVGYLGELEHVIGRGFTSWGGDLNDPQALLFPATRNTMPSSWSTMRSIGLSMRSRALRSMTRSLPK